MVLEAGPPKVDRLLAAACVSSGGGCSAASLILERPRIANLIRRALLRKLLVITAPAGYGKTVALSAAVHSLPHAVLWLEVGPADVSASAFAERFLSRAGMPEWKTPDARADSGPMPLARSMVGVLTERFPRGIQVVLDGLDGSPSPHQIEALVRHAVELAPAMVRFAISSRTEPAIRLPGLVRSAQTARITEDRLVFTLGEVEQLLIQAWGVPVSPDVVRTAWELTEGWPQGLREILCRFPTPAGSRDLLRLAGEPGVHPVLPSPVLLPGDPDRDLMLAISLLPAITPRAVDALTGVRGLWGRVEALAASNPLFQHVSQDEVVLLPSARRMLQEQAHQDWDDRTLNRHRVAIARMMERQGDHLEALALFLAAGDGTGAARVVRAAGIARPARWDPMLFLHLADRFQNCHDLDPAVVTVCAVTAWIRGDRRRCRVLCEEGLSQAHSDSERVALLTLRAAVECFEDATSGSWSSPKLLDALEDNALLWPRVWRARCLLHHGQLADAHSLLAGLDRRLEQTGDVFHARWSRLCVADLHAQQGRYGLALEKLGGSSASGRPPDAAFDMRTLELRARVQAMLGEFQLGMTTAQDALTTARSVDALPRVVAHLAFLSNSAFASGENSMGEDWRQEAQELAKDPTAGQGSGAALHAAKARREWALGNPSDAMKQWSFCIRQPQDWWGGAWNRLEASFTMLRTGSSEAAQALSEAVVREALGNQANHLAANALLLTAHLAWQTGRRDETDTRLAHFCRVMERDRFGFFPAADPALIRWVGGQGLSLGSLASVRGGIQHSAETPSAGLGPIVVSERAPSVSITTFGPLRLRVGGIDVGEGVWKSRVKAKRFFEILLSSSSHRIHADEAVDFLWPEAKPGRGRHRLQSTVSDLRRVFVAAGLSPYVSLPFQQPFYTLIAKPPDVVISHVEFDTLLDKALAGPRTPETKALLRRATALYTGEFLEDARYDRFAEAMRRYLAERMREAVKALAAHADSWEEVLMCAQRAVEHDPYDEDAYRAVIEAYLALGRREAASLALHALRKRIVEDLGVSLPRWALELPHCLESSSQSQDIALVRHAFWNSPSLPAASGPSEVGPPDPGI